MKKNRLLSTCFLQKVSSIRKMMANLVRKPAPIFSVLEMHLSSKLVQ